MKGRKATLLIGRCKHKYDPTEQMYLQSHKESVLEKIQPTRLDFFTLASPKEWLQSITPAKNRIFLRHILPVFL